MRSESRPLCHGIALILIDHLRTTNWEHTEKIDTLPPLPQASF